MSEHLKYPEMMADIELCHEQLFEICQGKHNKAVMRIPPRQADFDMQLSAALDELKAYRKLGTVEQCKQSIAAWNTRATETEPRSEWISVKDRLPEPATLSLVCVEGIENSVLIAVFNGEKWYRNNRVIFITHWMPIPKPPLSDQPKGEF